ncbi:PPPDE putative peptidase domain-containing protein [Chytriomyces sp. MP71]|nr:PPPDE putative peptidase domain-containing protein [Chytriomyces sp. MP71]
MPRVQLYVYDLSQGMAAAMSVALTGKHIPGIWHTAVVVFGKEVYFGQGITSEAPGTTPHGHLVERIDMGETAIPEDVFWEYIDSMRETWTAEKYHLLENNCNNFSNEVCQFLVGKKIPNHITGLPAEFLSTPFGQQLAPMLSSMFGPSRIAAEHRAQPELQFSSTSTATSAHPHAKANFASLKGLTREPILFAQSSNLGVIFGKVKGWLEESGIARQGDVEVLDGIKRALEQKYAGADMKGTVNGTIGKLPAGWWDVYDRLLHQLDQDQTFALIDILRLLLLDAQVAASLIADSPSKLITLLWRLQRDSHATPAKSLHLMHLRLTCNVFAHKPVLAHCLALHPADAPAGQTPPRTVMTATLVDGLLSAEEAVRQCAASLAFNMALEAALGRPTSAAGGDAVYEEWSCEMVAAILKALEEERGVDIGEVYYQEFFSH